MSIVLKKNIILLNPEGNCEELFEELQLPFSTTHQHIPVGDHLPENPFEYANTTVVIKLLRMKAPHESLCYLHVKRVISIEGTLLPLPQSKNEARNFLKRLSNRQHRVTTAVGIRYDQQLSSFVVASDVTMKCLSEKIIQQYIETGEPFEQDIGYNIMGVGQNLVSRIDGCKYNVAGLPTKILKDFLSEKGIMSVSEEAEVHGH